MKRIIRTNLDIDEKWPTLDETPRPGDYIVGLKSGLPFKVVKITYESDHISVEVWLTDYFAGMGMEEFDKIYRKRRYG